MEDKKKKTGLATFGTSDKSQDQSKKNTCEISCPALYSLNTLFQVVVFFFFFFCFLTEALA